MTLPSQRLRLPLLLCLLLLAALSPTTLDAQSSELRGRVVGPEGDPVAGISVTLHRVTDEGGAEIGRALSDEEGEFVIEMDLAADGGVYFAATRFDGALYMGQPFRSLAEIIDDYQIVVGVGGFAGGPAVQGPSGPEVSRNWTVLLLFGLLGLAAIAIPLYRGRRGPSAQRAILAELARLEEDHARRAPAADEKTADDDYQAMRESLRARLRDRSRDSVHAADND